MDRGFASFHPFTCFIYFLGTAALVMLNRHPVFLVCGLVILVLLNVVQDRGKSLRRWSAGFLMLFLFFLIVNPLLNHRGTHILFYFSGNPIMLEAVIKGLTVALSLVCLLVMFVSYNRVISADKFLFLFAKVVPKWALLAMLTMRFVPLLRRRMGEIETVQKAKGLTASEGSLRNRANSGMKFVQILLTWSLEEALQTADSMEARGYGLSGRSRYQPYKMARKDWGALVFLIVAGTISLAGWKLGYGRLSVYPVFEPIFLHGREWFYLCVFLGFLGFPIAVEGRQHLRWVLHTVLFARRS